VNKVIKQTRDVKSEIKMTNDYFDGLLERKEAERTKKMETARGLYNEVYNLVNKIRADYKENQDGLVKLVDYYQNTFEYNQKIMAELASQLVKKLVANTFTKKYDTQRENMVKSYDKITQFLAAFSKESVPELPRDARKGKK
jgi:aromatic ring hydroxylase